MRLIFLAVSLASLAATAQVSDGGPPTTDAGITTLSVSDAAAPVENVPPPREPTFVEKHWKGTQLLTRSLHYEAGFVVGGGGLIHLPGVATIPLTGVSMRERNGLLSILVTGILGNALQAYSAVQIDNVRTTSTSSTNYNSDGSRTVVTNTTTTANVKVLKTDEQVQKEQAEFRQGVIGHTWLDLTVYADNFLGWNRGVTGGSGYDLSVGGHGELFTIGDLPVVLDIGLQMANVRVPAPAGSGVSNPFLYYASGGILARVYVPLTRIAMLSAEWVINFLSFDLIRGDADLRAEGRVVTSPLKLTLEVDATDRFYLKGQAILGGLGFDEGRLGGQLTLGVRL